MRWRELPRDPRMLGLLRDLARSELTGQGVDATVVDDVVLCLDEACANAVLHGGGAFWVGWSVVGGEVVVEVCDEGLGPPTGPFAGAAGAEPGVEQLSGRGLFIIERLAGRVETTARGGLTCLRLVFPAGRPRQPARPRLVRVGASGSGSSRSSRSQL